MNNDECKIIMESLHKYINENPILFPEDIISKKYIIMKEITEKKNREQELTLHKLKNEIMKIKKNIEDIELNNKTRIEKLKMILAK